MFSFHRPKVYRSPTGCCICKAKSSSSRFTDSKKYEEDFLKCFQLTERRRGEICNACVLLVKRWKKLPIGIDRNWSHVVDARAGPGMKSMSKFKSRNKKIEQEKKKKKESVTERVDSPPLSDKSEGNEDAEMADVDFSCEGGASGSSSRTGSPAISDDCEEIVSSKNRRRRAPPKRRVSGFQPSVTDFASSDYWKRESICCGIIFRGLCGEVVVDSRFYKPCSARVAQCTLQPKAAKTEGEVVDAAATKMYCDSSSDSGYDESSNPGAIVDSAFKKDQVSIEEINSQIPQTN